MSAAAHDMAAMPVSGRTSVPKIRRCRRHRYAHGLPMWVVLYRVAPRASVRGNTCLRNARAYGKQCPQTASVTSVPKIRRCRRHRDSLGLSLWGAVYRVAPCASERGTTCHRSARAYGKECPRTASVTSVPKIRRCRRHRDSLGLSMWGAVYRAAPCAPERGTTCHERSARAYGKECPPVCDEKRPRAAVAMGCRGCPRRRRACRCT